MSFLIKGKIANDKTGVNNWHNKPYYGFEIFQKNKQSTLCPFICPYIEGLEYIPLKIYILFGILARTSDDIRVDHLERGLIEILEREKIRNRCFKTLRGN